MAAGATPPAGLREIYKSFLQDVDMLAMLLETRPKVPQKIDASDVAVALSKRDARIAELEAELAALKAVP